LFGGDTYVVRYTEKNPFLFFNDWLLGESEDYAYDYRNYINIPYPCYWMDNRKIYSDLLNVAHRYRHLDVHTFGGSISAGLTVSPFYVAKGYFYLSCNGVRDFFVEAEAPAHYRDWEDDITKRFYDPYTFTDTDYMFRSDNMKAEPFYKLDPSLGVNKFYTQYISFGRTLGRDYDPDLAYTCFQYYPRRVAYSLPQSEEFRKDNWRVFLANNYKDFNTPVTAIKGVNKTGSLFFQKEESPLMVYGSDTLQTSGNTKITIGDGGLFNQPLQNIVNADKSFQYANCRSRMSIISTPFGIFWVSQQAGKVFHYSGEGLNEIAKDGMKYWFAKYLPSYIATTFPAYPHIDNPVIGVGVQCIYDSMNETLYICKKDYKPKEPMTYVPGKGFSLGPCPPGSGFAGYDSSGNPLCVIYGPAGGPAPVYVQLGDPLYFEDASWTVSYSCKNKAWASYHDWHPSYNIETSRHFLTTQDRGLWRHNERTDLYCNFYGVDYPFEVIYPVRSGVDNTTLRNVEYRLDVLKYGANSSDKYQYPSENFDQALVFTDSQISQWLNLFPKSNDPYADSVYPIIGLSANSILYSWKEDWRRFSALWDITNDRNVTTEPFVTDANGYTWTVNPLYVDVLKSEFERIKIRSRAVNIFLRRKVSDEKNYILYFSRSGAQYSPR
jgi:hypothetical protein